MYQLKDCVETKAQSKQSAECLYHERVRAVHVPGLRLPYEDICTVQGRNCCVLTSTLNVSGVVQLLKGISVWCGDITKGITHGPASQEA